MSWIAIGGEGADRVTASISDDQLIGGYTSYDTEMEVLEMLVTEWGSARALTERVENLNGAGADPPNDPYYLIAVVLDQTYFGDLDVNRLMGGGGNHRLIGDTN